jgi:phosphoserine aminotransferase
MTDRVFNFSPGPAVLPVEVLEYLQEQELEIVGIEKARLN